MSVVRQKKVSPQPLCVFRAFFFDRFFTLSWSLEQAMWSFRMVTCSKCTIVTDLMNNLSGFELFCRSYDSLMDSSKMKSNKVLEVWAFYWTNIQELMQIIYYSIKIINYWQYLTSPWPCIGFFFFLKNHSMNGQLKRWITEHIIPLFMYDCLLVHPIELKVKYCYAPRNYKCF